MKYKIDPDLLKNCFKDIDLSKLKRDFSGSLYPSLHYNKMKPPFSAIPYLSTGKENLAARVKMAKSFEGLNVSTASKAKDIEQIMALLIMRELVNPDNLEGNVVDFGMGTGPGAYVLKQYGENITGVDSSGWGVQIAIEEGILPRDRALVKDGFDYLSGLQPGSLDFIGAFMMYLGFPHARLYQESQRVLKTGGQLLITGGLVELENELQRTLGRYGKLEKVITVHGDAILGNVAFTYTKR